MNFFGGAGLIVIQALAGLILGIAILRVVLPLSGARFRNPLCQLIYQLTNPILVPLTRLIPNWRSISVAGVLLAWLLSLLITAAVLALIGAPFDLLSLLWFGTATLVHAVLSLYFWAILIAAIMSLFSPDRSNPLVELLTVLVNPVLKHFRRLPPRLQGIDLSPMWALLLIRLVQYTLSYVGFLGPLG
jgi:YggT family protein